MTTNHISAHIEDIFGLEVSDSLVSRITDKIMPVVKEWQQRPLKSIYAEVDQNDDLHHKFYLKFQPSASEIHQKQVGLSEMITAF